MLLMNGWKIERRVWVRDEYSILIPQPFGHLQCLRFIFQDFSITVKSLQAKTSQVEYSDHRIPLDPSGKHRK